MKTSRTLSALSLCALMLLAVIVPAAAAVSITVDPGAYSGVWSIGGQSFVGAQTLSITPGANIPISIGVSGFLIDVDGVGNVVSHNPAAATGSGTTLSFNVATITIDPGAYGRPDLGFNGTWGIPGGIVPNTNGVQVVPLVGGLSYLVSIGVSGFLFDVDGAGAVSSQNAAAAHGTGSTLFFHNSPITVDPGNYGRPDIAFKGTWSVVDATPNTNDVRALVVLPGLTYRANVGLGGFLFNVDASGNVSSQNPVTATGSGATLAFHNTNPITIDPGTYGRPDIAFQGTWVVPSVTPNTNGARALIFVPGLGYDVLVGPQVDSIQFTIAADGTVTSLNASAAIGSLELLTLRNSMIQVVPANGSVGWGMPSVTPGTNGTQTLVVVPGVRYQLASGAENVLIRVFEPCAVDPSSVTLSAVPFMIACVSPLPVANAGNDQTRNEEQLVQLDGTGSSGTGLAFSWEQVAGPAAVLSDPASATPTFTAPFLSGGFGSQTLTFQLTVSNGAGSSLDSVNVTVVNVNHAPESHPVAPSVVNEGSSVTLVGTSSFDPDSDGISFAWEQTAGPLVSLSGSTTATASFVAPLLAGGTGSGVTLRFRLTVSDGALSSSEEVAVGVEQVNHTPTANAGAAQTVTGGTPVALNGAASFDSDGDSLQFAWTQIAGPSVALAGATGAMPTFTAPIVVASTALTFRLVVSDTQSASSPSHVIVTVLRPNSSPRCDLASASPSSLWPPNHGLRQISITSVTDPENDGVTITVTGVTQDEPTNGAGDGDTSPDAVLQGATALVRAERAGPGDGRVYFVHFGANDGQGGACTGSVRVIVPKSQKHGAVDSGQNYNSTTP